MANKTIGILTGGGDVPGLNAVIKSVVYSALGKGGYDVVGIRRGWAGLVNPKLEDGFDNEYCIRLDRDNTRSIDRTGGTYLHTSRTKPSRMKADQLPEHVQGKLGACKEVEPGIFDMAPVVIENLQRLGVDHLLTIGGDDTLSYSSVLSTEHGFPVVAVPKTMDNDVQGTEYCIGFSTALTRAVDAVNRLRTTLGSHERIGVFRIFGRDAGFTALYTAYITSVRCCLPEVPFNLENLIELLVKDKENNPSNYSLVILSEGATWEGREVEEYGPPDDYGHRKKVNIAEAFSDQIKKLTRETTRQDTVIYDLTYQLRSGDPDFLDKMIASTFATMAFECIDSGGAGRMMAIQNGCYTDTAIPDPGLGARKVDLDTMYNIDRYRPNYSNKRGRPIFLTKV